MTIERIRVTKGSKRRARAKSKKSNRKSNGEARLPVENISRRQMEVKMRVDSRSYNLDLVLIKNKRLIGCKTK